MFLFNRFLRLTIIRFVLSSLVTIVLVVGCATIAHSQLPSLPTAARNDPRKPPSNVTRIGEYEVANVYSPLDRKFLFEVVSPTIFNRENPPEKSLPVEVRAEEISQRLQRVTKRAIYTNQNAIISITTLNNHPILQLQDDKTARPLRLLTVTEPDADYYGKPVEILAEEWRKELQTEVERIDKLFTSKVLLKRTGEALQIILGLLLGSGILWFLRRILVKKQKLLQTYHQEPINTVEQTAIKGTEEVITDTQPTQFSEEEAEVIARYKSRLLAIIHKKFNIERQQGIYSFLLWLVFWTFILMWYVGITIIIYHVPFLMRWSTYAIATPLALLTLWFFISLAIKISKSLIDSLIRAWVIHPSLSLSETQRITLRTATVSGALKGLATVVFITLGILWSLGLFDVPTNSILAGGAVIGIAISLGSQNLIKDLVNGCLILMEDQFAVGDVIQIGDKSGLVENLNLRVTQLRNAEGQLITIPNSNIVNVCNLTRLWSRVDFSIIVAYESDPKQVLDVLRKVSQQFYSKPEWRARLLEPPEVLGIDDISHIGMLVRVWIKTAPMEQWSVGREFRLLVRQAFEENNIRIGKP